MAGPREKMIDESMYGFGQAECTSAVCDLYDRAWRALDAGDITKARVSYEEALSREPANAQAHIGLAACSLYEKDFERATRSYHRALQLDPNSASAHIGLGNIQYQASRFAASASRARIMLGSSSR